MKSFFSSAFFLFLLGVQASASQSYKLVYTVETTGNQTRTGSVVIAEGQIGTVSFQDTTFKFTPTKVKEGVVKIEVVILSSSHEKPKRGTIITRLNSPAELTQTSGPSLSYRIKITPSI